MQKKNLSKNIILFDMDNTLVCEDTGDLWGEFLDKKNLVNTTDKIMREKFNKDYAEKKLDIIKYYQFEISLINKICLSLRKSWQEEFFENFVKPKISHLGKALIENYKKYPDTEIILITATLSFIAKKVADYCGLQLIATEAEYDKNFYTGNISGIPSFGKDKITRLNN